MSKKISILHISDLHKIPDTDYEGLVQSLLSDRDRYTKDGILNPCYIVVSGDLVQGGNTEDIIKGQYKECQFLLSRLACEFLAGDKERILIVPGNHDVSFPHSRRSMTKQPDENRDQNLKELRENNPLIRWKWDDFSFYKITDVDTYNSRFQLFVDFYNDFYEGKRKFPDRLTQEASFIKFPKDHIAFILFNSCAHLDHLNDIGNIEEDSITSVLSLLRSSFNEGFLNIGIWHHHYYGSPKETNYVNRDIIGTMAHCYIRMGLFGHQHKSQVADFYSEDIALPEGVENEKVLLVSSGTLFGGSKVLPSGYKRQYNIIEINIDNGTANVDIHVREDHNVNVENKIPYWGKKRINDTGSIRAHINLKELNEDEILADLVRFVNSSKDFIYGFTTLESMNLKGKLYESLRSQFLRNIKDNQFILQNLHPRTKNDYLLLMRCAIEEHDREMMEKLKNDKTLFEMLSDTFVGELYNEMLNQL